MEAVEYVGYDISKNSIRLARENNQDEPNMRFEQLDLVDTVPPTHDVFMVRDVIQHLPLTMGVEALRNVVKSGSRYLIVSSYPSQPRNVDIAIGGYYGNNVYATPFDVLRLAQPLDSCENYDGRFRSMGSKLMLIDLRE